MDQFELISEYTPTGDQPEAIEILSRGMDNKKRDQVLLGVTGSGKTFTMAHVIAKVNRPALVIAPNKTLAAQLFHEFRLLFPQNAVEYFVSYYDYYQPEAYIPTTDTYIQKDSSINDMIDKMRHSATRSVLSRRDVLVVASVSCIFGLGAPEDYLEMRIELHTNSVISRERLLKDLVAMQYQRNDTDFHRGTFRVRGDRVEIFPTYEESQALRVDFFGDTIDALSMVDPLRGVALDALTSATIFPASHYVTSRTTLKRAMQTILVELKQQVETLRSENRLLEAQRVEERTRFDLEMIQELGYCSGIENYSRHLTGRAPGDPPPTLLDYFPADFLMFLDESHMAIPQLRAMYKGDRSRKETLVQYGFRLPSALDNRPLRFDEWRQRVHQVVYVSATPAEYELEKANGAVAEQIVRPTGLVDPMVEVRNAGHQVDDLYAEIVLSVERRERVLVTTLTKRMAEDLTEYYSDLSIKVRYLHSDISTLERMEIIRDLRMGLFDVLVGINLLREGLDIPEVALVAILDADKEGFLRSTRSLIQTFGRAARHVSGRVILYADITTRSMAQAIDETDRRRQIQKEYNRVHQIVPASIHKEIPETFALENATTPLGGGRVAEPDSTYGDLDKMEHTVEKLERQMKAASKALEFEQAAELRDKIKELKQKILFEI